MIENEALHAERITNVAERIAVRPEIAGVQAYEYFRSDLSTQKAGFISGVQAQLEPHYPDLSRDRISSLASDTEEALRSLMVLKNEKAVALYDVIEYRFAEMFMISLAADIQNDQIIKAKANAFNACVRLFRGTTVNEAGVVYLKDLAYFKGQELAWSVLANVETQEDLDLLFAGKLDLTNPDHQRIAQRILEDTKKGPQGL